MGGRLMRRLVWDIETDGLLPEVTKLHCITILDIDTDEKIIATDNPYIPADDVKLITIADGLALLSSAELLIGHNTLSYDIPVIRKLYPRFSFKGAHRDTIVMARVVWPKDHLREKDFTLHKKERIPGNLIGSYSLQAFGYRLMEYKGDFKGEWHTFTQEMGDYAVQDVVVTRNLWQRLQKEEWPEESYELEHIVQEIIFRQEMYGFKFDEDLARSLIAEIQGYKYELEQELQKLVPPWEVRTTHIAGANNKKLGRIKGQAYEKVKVVTFNPGSRLHIAHVLRTKYGWVPTKFTPDGRAQVDESVLDQLPYPEAKLLSEYLMVTKRLGQISDGKEAWIKTVGSDGRIHGRVTTNGAVTGRMTHSKPNMAQVPGVKKDKQDNVIYGKAGGWGAECRKLFTVAKGKVLVGCDAAALELRCLAAYMGDPAYIDTAINGTSAAGTDVHSVNSKALGLTRGEAKTWFYAFLYGAGDANLGNGDVNRGRSLRARFMKNLPALGKLVESVKARVDGRIAKIDGKTRIFRTIADTKAAISRARKEGKDIVIPPQWLRGLDGRRLQCRSSHSALNTLLQSAGAVIMKKAQAILDHDLQELGLVPGVNYEFVATVHDEWELEVDEDKGDLVGRVAKEAIKKAGEVYNFACPLEGEYKIGSSWFATH